MSDFDEGDEVVLKPEFYNDIAHKKLTGKTLKVSEVYTELRGCEYIDIVVFDGFDSSEWISENFELAAPLHNLVLDKISKQQPK